MSQFDKAYQNVSYSILARAHKIMCRAGHLDKKQAAKFIYEIYVCLMIAGIFLMLCFIF